MRAAAQRLLLAGTGCGLATNSYAGVVYGCVQRRSNGTRARGANFTRTLHAKCTAASTYRGFSRCSQARLVSYRPLAASTATEQKGPELHKGPAGAIRIIAAAVRIGRRRSLHRLCPDSGEHTLQHHRAMASRRQLCLVALCTIGNALLAPAVPGCSLTNCRAKSGGFGATTNKAPSKKSKAKAFTKKQAQLEADRVDERARALPLPLRVGLQKCCAPCHAKTTTAATPEALTPSKPVRGVQPGTAFLLSGDDAPLHDDFDKGHGGLGAEASPRASTPSPTSRVCGCWPKMR